MADPQETAAKAAATNWTEFRLWGALVLSFLSLIWSETNRRTTKSLSEKIRAENIQLDEFRSTVRTPLHDALQSCEEIGKKVEAIGLSAKPLQDLLEDIKNSNLQVIEALSTLETRLSDANDSQFASSSDWLDGFNETQDKVLNAFNAASNEINNESARKAALTSVKSTMMHFRSRIKNKIDQEIKYISGEK